MTSPSLTVDTVHSELPGWRVDVERVGAADAGLAHAPGDHRGVRGLAAARGQDALRGDHAGQVVGVGLAPDQDHPLAGRGHLGRAVRVEDGLAHGGARRGGDALGDRLRAAAEVERGEHQLRELRAADPAQRLVEVDEPSSTSWVAMMNAAAAVRLPTRVCSIHSLPRSMVNSMSHRSL